MAIMAQGMFKSQSAVISLLCKLHNGKRELKKGRKGRERQREWGREIEIDRESGRE